LLIGLMVIISSI